MTSDTPVRIGLIVGSTRPNRFADVPVRWVLDAAAERDDLVIETLDLREWPLPFYEEPLTPVASKGAYTSPVANRWRAHVGTFDAFIATAAEYNHGPTAVLKNAFDSAFNEWATKPISFVAYGAAGGARAVEQLRLNVVELQMAPIKHAVHINMEPFIGVLMQGKALDDYPYLVQSRDTMLTQLVWWARALRAAREADTAVAAA